MRTKLKYLPEYLGVRISKKLDTAIWQVVDKEGMDRAKWVRQVLERACKEAQNEDTQPV